MPIVDIHGKKVHIKEGSQSAKHAVDYLSGLEKSEAHNYFHMASTNKYSHFETPRHAETVKAGIEHDMTLEHQSDGSYILRKRTQD